MTECIHTLFSAWGAPSAKARASATDGAIGQDFWYGDINYIKMFAEMALGAIAKVVNISERDDSARATIEFIINDNMSSQRGQYFIDIKDDKSVRIVGCGRHGRA